MACLTALFLFTIAVERSAATDFELKDRAPVVKLTEPGSLVTYCLPSTLRLTIEAIDPDHRIDQVEFFLAFSSTNSLGVVREPPYTLIWSNIIAPFVTPNGMPHRLYAKVTDKLGPTLTTEARDIGFWNGPCTPQLVLESRDSGYLGGGVLLGLNDVMTLRVPVYNLDNNINPVQIFLGTNLLVAVPQAAPYLRLANLPVGQHTFSTKVKDLNGREYTGNSLIVTVVRLSIDRIELLRNGQFFFQAKGALPGVPVDIYASTNLRDWKGFDRVVPDVTEFTFTSPAATNNQPLFFRLGISTRPLYPVR